MCIRDRSKRDSPFLCPCRGQRRVSLGMGALVRVIENKTVLLGPSLPGAGKKPGDRALPVEKKAGENKGDPCLVHRFKPFVGQMLGVAKEGQLLFGGQSHDAVLPLSLGILEACLLYTSYR